MNNQMVIRDIRKPIPVLLASVLFVAAILNVACVPRHQDAEQKDVSLYLPLQIGNTWTYVVSGTLNGIRVNSFVVRIRLNDTLRHTDGSLLFSYGEYINQFISDSLKQRVSGYYTFRDGTIYDYNSTGDSDLYHRPTYKIPLLRGPLDIGRQWQYERDGKISSYTLASIEQIKFKGTLIDSVVLVVRHWSGAVDSSWYAPGIGLLKECVNAKDIRKVSRLEDFGVTR